MFVSWFQTYFMYLVFLSVMYFLVNVFSLDCVPKWVFIYNIFLFMIISYMKEINDFGIVAAANKACTRLLLLVRKIKSLVSVRKSG